MRPPMSAEASPSPSETAPVTRARVLSDLLVLLLWLLLQLAMLALAAGQIRLSDHFPRPAEGMALAEMAIVQICFSAMLAPMLFRSPGITLMMIATAWPMLQLAGLLSVAPAATILLVATYVTLWMAGL